MIGVAVRILVDLQTGIAVKAENCLTESTLIGIGTKEGTMIGSEETIVRESSGIEIGTEKRAVKESFEIVIGTEKGAVTEKGVMIEIKVMIERENGSMIMINSGIQKGTVAEGIERMEDIVITVLIEVGAVAGAEAGAGAKVGSLFLPFITNDLIIIRAHKVIKAKRKRWCRPTWPSLRIYMVT